MLIKLYNAFGEVVFQKKMMEFTISKPQETQSKFNFMHFIKEALNSGIELNQIDLAYSINKINQEFCLNIERIMLVDDDPIQLENYKIFLSRMGHYVETFESGEVALKCFLSDPTRFSCVFTDNQMNQISGCELSKKIKKINPKVKIWIITGSLNSIDNDIFDAEIEASIAKPIRLTTFTGALGLSDNQPIHYELNLEANGSSRTNNSNSELVA